MLRRVFTGLKITLMSHDFVTIDTWVSFHYCWRDAFTPGTLHLFNWNTNSCRPEEEHKNTHFVIIKLLFRACRSQIERGVFFPPAEKNSNSYFTSVLCLWPWSHHGRCHSHLQRRTAGWYVIQRFRVVAVWRMFGAIIVVCQRTSWLLRLNTESR